jgi:hypothetical protein
MRNIIRQTRRGPRLRWSATIIAIASLVLPVMGQSSVKLVWNANPEPDIAGYKVHIGTTSGVFTEVRDVGKTTSHVVSNLTPSTTYYFAVQAYNTSSVSSGLSTQLPHTTLSAYQAWAVASALSGADAEASAAPHNDGVPNILKFAFNMNPAGPDMRVLEIGTGTAGLPAGMVEEGTAGPVLRMEFMRRKNSGLAYTPLMSTDLASYQPMNGDTTVVQINVDWERVVVRKPFDPETQHAMFATVRVEMP